MNLLWATFVVVGFTLTLERLKLATRAREVVSRAADCLDVLRDTSMDDAAKERVLQDQTFRLLGLLGVLLGGSILALGLPLSVVWLLELAGVTSLEIVLSVLGRLDFLVGVTVLGSLTYLLVRWARRT